MENSANQPGAMSDLEADFANLADIQDNLPAFDKAIAMILELTESES